jgi:hypothetical protein
MYFLQYCLCFLSSKKTNIVMKKYLLLLTLSIVILSANAKLNSKVDERFELTGIAFRLADAEEFVNNQVEPYVNDIDSYFSKHKNHALIDYIKEIRNDYELGFNVASGISAILEIRSGKVQLIKDADLDALIKADYRWTKEVITKFVFLLNKFYRDSKFNVFYLKNKELYSRYEEKFDEFINEFLKTEVFEDFYGQPFGSPQIITSLTNGRNNYAFFEYKKGVKPNNGIVIGIGRVDSAFMPVYDHETRRVIVHELSHTFANPIVDKYKEQMQAATDTIFPHIEKRLERYFYGKESIVAESFTSLFTNIYLQSLKYSVFYFVTNDGYRGFVWQHRAMSFMNNFINNRQLYPTIQDFFPQLIAFYNRQGKEIKQILEEEKQFTPHVVNVFPAPNSKVPADLKEIKVEFSRKMHRGQKGGFRYVNNDKEMFPVKDNIKVTYWDEDEKIYTIPVKLEKNKKYGMVLSTFMQSSEGVPLEEDFEILFETTE